MLKLIYQELFKLLFIIIFTPLSLLAISPFAGFEYGFDLGKDTTVVYSSPVVADIDGDTNNGQEIVVVSSQGDIFAITATGALLWKAKLPNASCLNTNSNNKTRSSPAVGKLFGNDLTYIVTGYGGLNAKKCGGGVAAYDGITGELKWDFDLKKYNKKDRYWSKDYSVFSTPALFDVNGDKTLEIAFGSFDRRIYLLAPQGKKPLSTIVAADTVWPSAAMRRMNDDQKAAMFIGTDMTKNNLLKPPTKDGGFLYRFRTVEPLKAVCSMKGKKNIPRCKAMTKFKTKKYGFRDKKVVTWKRFYNQVIFSSPVLAKLFPDQNKLQVIIGSGTYYPEKSNNKNGKWLSIVDASTGKELQRIITHGISHSSVAVGDINGSGNISIIATMTVSESTGGSTTGKLAAYNPTSQEMIWRTNSESEGNDDNASDLYSPIIADLNGNGTQEVIVINGKNVLIYNGNTGHLLKCSSNLCKKGKSLLKMESTSKNTPVAADLDGDGTLELIAASGNKVYVWHDFSSISGDPAGNNPPYKADWPMWRGDTARTGSHKN